MQNTKALFKSIDDAADKVAKERDAAESRRFARQKEIGEQLSKCEFLKHVNGMYARSRCKNPIRTTIKVKGGLLYRDCLGEDCPLIK